MILRKDYVKLIHDGKAQVKVEKTNEHNEMLNLIFQNRREYGFDIKTMSTYFSKSGTGYDSQREKYIDLPIIHASDIILDNTVIKVESIEHGKKVVEWWREQGVYVDGWDGDRIGGYYGVYDGVFDFRFILGDKKTITLPETIKGQILIRQENNMEKIIKWTDAQELIDMVDGYCGWKGKLLDLWAKSIVLKIDIYVPTELIQQAREEASERQKEVIDRIFGKEKEEIDLWNKTGIDGLGLYNEGFCDRCLVSIASGCKNSFWLNMDYKWELDGNRLIISHK
jgi:hypothetical protein